MARRRNTTDNPSTVANRRKIEAERQARSDQLRAAIVEETKAARRATAKRLKDKPEDTRTLAQPDPAASF